MHTRGAYEPHTHRRCAQPYTERLHPNPSTPNPSPQPSTALSHTCSILRPNLHAQALHAAVHRTDYVGDTPHQLARIMGRTAVARYLDLVLQHGRAEAAARSGAAMAEDAAALASLAAGNPPPRSYIDDAVERATVDSATEEGPEAPGSQAGGGARDAGGYREVNLCTVGPPDKPVVNEVPWGPGTANPTPWECWFCSRKFATYASATEHEEPCGRLHGWEINEQEAREVGKALEEECNKRCNAKPGQPHSVECFAARVPYAWVRVQEDMEFDARSTGTGGQPRTPIPEPRTPIPDPRTPEPLNPESRTRGSGVRGSVRGSGFRSSRQFSRISNREN
jgi:hypothetical protein